MLFQFTLRSLLIVVLLWAVVLSLLHYPVEPMVFLGDAAFWFVLLAPFAILQFLVNPESRKREHVRPFLALVPAAWYCVLIVLFYSDYDLPVTWVKVGTVAGTVLVLLVLITARGRAWYVLMAPLAFAIVSGTVWLVVTS
jgi:hypothetical protein